MAINFPSLPTIGQLYTYGENTWQWSGEYWGVYSAQTGYVTSVTSSGNGYSVIDSFGGNSLSLKSFSGTNITITDSGGQLNFYVPLNGGSGGQLYYFNISKTQTPYLEIATSSTTVSEQTITSAVTSGNTVTLGQFLTPSGQPGVSIIPGGVWSFYLHSYKQNSSASFDIFCDVYKRTTGGTETFLFTTDPTPVTSNSPTPSMEISDVYFSGTPLSTSDRILVNVRTTNTGNATYSVSFVSEGTQHYSYFSSPLLLPTTDTYVTAYTYNNNVFTLKQNNGQPDLTATINSVTGWTVNGNLTVTGNTSVQNLSATTIGSSGYCVGDIFVSRIHSCSPLNINPNDEGNVYFGSTSGVTIDLINNRFGVGTSNPLTKFQVDDSVYRMSFNGSQVLLGEFNISRPTGNNGDYRYSFIATGNTSPAYLNVNAASGEFRHFAANTFYHTFYAWGNEVMRLTSGGTVGIGTTNPQSTLHVSGNTRMDGTLTVTGNTSLQTVTATTVSATTIGVYSGSVTMYSANAPLPPTVATPFTDDYNRVSLSPGGTPSLTYTNTNTGAGNSTIVSNYLNIVNGAVAGLSYTTVPLSGFGSPFNPTLSSNSSLSTIEWSFNLRTNRASIFSGFLAGNYGGAVILAGTSGTLQNTGNGYALVYGTTGTRNWKLVRYTGGLQGTQTDIVSGGLFSANTSYVSARIVYTPSTNTWSYYFRDDGTTAWGDPTTVNTLIGSAVDSTYTSSLMSVFGVYFNYSTAANQNLQFDNLRVQQTTTNPTTPLDEIVVKNYSGSDVFKVKDDGTTTMSGSVTSTSGFFGSFSGTHLGNGSALVLGQSGVMITGTTALSVTNATTALTLIPGLSTTITVGSQTMVYIQTNGGVNTTATTSTGGSALDIAILVDGAVLAAGGYQRIYADNPTGNATVTNWVANWNTSVLLTLSAGSHTIEVDAVYVAGSTATVSGGAGAIKQGTLTVMVLKNI